MLLAACLILAMIGVGMFVIGVEYRDKPSIRSPLNRKLLEQGNIRLIAMGLIFFASGLGYYVYQLNN